jgi:4-carboxymuconolactone decarboxylase
MTESDTDRVERGRAVADQISPGAADALFRQLNGVVPDFDRLALGSVLADIWDRDQLSMRERSIVRLAVLAATGQPESASRTAVSTALHLGLSQQDIAEVFVQTIPQVGLIRVIAALEMLSRYLDSGQAQQAS